ncbi:MAG: endonuclease domain-containing protein [Candidatus Kerfeldbacteria bacterium]|nr:endonuclease domain-containing protein [Candidatus Kerfeldbacteria bacterium]
MRHISDIPPPTLRSRDLRRHMTEQEVRLWVRLKQRGLLGYKFRRQQPIGRYYVDFYCPELKLAIELDGGHHFEPNQRAYDLVRQRSIESLGIKVVRYTNSDINQGIDVMLEDLAHRLRRRAFRLPRRVVRRDDPSVSGGE